MLFAMSEGQERQQVRWFIGAWMRGRDRATLAEVQAAVLARFAADPAFVEAFLPIALGGDAAQVRAALHDPLERLVREELTSLQTRRAARFTLEDGCWVRRPEWARSGE